MNTPSRISKQKVFNPKQNVTLAANHTVMGKIKPILSCARVSLLAHLLKEEMMEVALKAKGKKKLAALRAACDTLKSINTFNQVLAAAPR